MSRKKDLAKNTAILSLGKICTQCISFLLLPLYTAKLDTSEYGIFDLMITYCSLLLPLVNWQFDQGIFRFMLDCRGNQREQKKLFSSVLAMNTVQSLVFCVIMLIIHFCTKFQYCSFLAAYVVLHVYTALLLQFVRGLGKNTIYAIASFISASSTVILNVIMLVFLNSGLSGLFIATLISQCFTIVYLLLKINPIMYFSSSSIDKNVISRIRKYSLPLIPNNLAWWVVNVSDRTIVSYVLGVAVNGIYTVANKFSGVFIQFYNILNLSWTETVSLHFEDEDRDTFLSEMITTMYKIFVCGCFLIVAIMPFVFPVLVNEKYSDAYNHVIILMYAMLLRVIVGLYSCVYVATKESKKIAYTSIASAIINILCNIMFINRIGLYAASISTVIAFGVMAFVRYIDINKNIHMKIERKALYSSIVIGIVLMMTYYYNNFVINCCAMVGILIYSLFLNYSTILQVLKYGKKALLRK